jgi:hypothetical protein
MTLRTLRGLSNEALYKIMRETKSAAVAERAAKVLSDRRVNG